MTRKLDISHEELQQLFELAQDVAHVGYWEWDTRSNAVHWSRQKIEIYGENSADFEPSFEKFLAVIDDRTRERVMAEIQAVLNGEKPFYDLQHQIRLRNGRKAWVHEKAFLTRDDEGRPLKLMGIVYDVTDKMLMLEELKDLESSQAWLKTHDALTGLLNREALEQRLTEATSREEAFVLVFVDLDDFKTINNAYGHLFGDVVLKRVGEALHRLLPEQAFRYGADEFVLLLRPDEYDGIQRQLQRLFRKPATIIGNRISLAYACGSARFPSDGRSPAELIKNANSALTLAKQSNHERQLAFQPYMSELFSAERKTLDALHQALEEDAFQVYYQPKVDVARRVIVGFEALVRWQGPDGGLIPPTVFLPVAERHDLLHRIDHLVLKRAVKQLAQWNETGHRLQMSVNFTGRDFHHHDNMAWLLEEVAPELQQQLVMEITENELMQCDTSQLEVIHRLKAQGLKLSLDDFGTGYSSLRYLHQLPIDQLKIDRSFVRNLPGDRKDEQLVEIIRHIVQQFGLECVVEGIETEAQQAFFRHLGLNLMQGYLFSKPLPADQATVMLQAPERAFIALVQH